MNKHFLFALTLAATSANSFAADAEKAPVMTLALYNGGQAQLIQPVELDQRTAAAAEQRIDKLAEALNEKLSKRLEVKFARDLRVTSR